MYAITEDVRASIEKNLPAAVGDVLKQRLEQADRDAAEVVALRSYVESLQRGIKDQEVRINDLQATVAQHIELSKRLTEIVERERNVKVRELELQLAAEQRVTTGFNDILKGLVRNVEFRNSFYESVSNQSFPTGTGGVTMSYTPETTSRTESRSAE